MFVRPRAAALAALGTWMAWSGAASAQNDVSLNRAGSGARAAGMGNAFIAVSDDGTAASWNPAGLAQLRQPEFSLVYGLSDRHVQLSALRSTDDRFAYTAHGTGDTSSSIDFASAAMPFAIAGKPVTVQGGWQRLYQLSGQVGGSTRRVGLVDASVPPVAIDRLDRLDGGIDVLSVAGAVKLTGHVALGTSVNFWRGDWNETVTLVEEPGPSGPTAFFSSFSEDSVRGTNAALGLLLSYPSWSAGIVHHWPFWASYTTNGYRRSSQAPEGRVSVSDARFRFPRSFGVGAAGRLPRRWTIAASLTYDDWTDAVIDRVPGIPPFNFLDGEPTELTTSRDTVSLNLGAEHLVLLDGFVIPLRLGFGWEPQGGMDPVVRDPVDYHLASVGTGYNTNTFKLDAAVQFRWASFNGTETLSVARIVQGLRPPDAVGRADAHEWRVKVSAIYRLP